MCKTAALVAIMARAIAAIGPYSNSGTTISAEPQLVGSTTSNGLVVYSLNYCAVVQTTACAITLSTGASISPETATATATATPGYASASASASSVTVVVDGSTTVVAVPESTWTEFTSTESPSNTDLFSQPVMTVTFPPDGDTTSDAAITSAPTADSSVGGILNSSSASSSASSGAASSSVSTSKSHGHGNSTSATDTRGPSATTGGGDAAPSDTGSGAVRVVPALALAAVVLAMGFFT